MYIQINGNGISEKLIEVWVAKLEDILVRKSLFDDTTLEQKSMVKLKTITLMILKAF